MNELPYILIEANDCSAFQNQEGHSEAIKYFLSQTSDDNVFRFGNSANKQDGLEIAYFNNRESLWFAGRLIGEAKFSYKDQDFKIKVNPRFGNMQLFRMLEEIFNIRLAKSKSLLTHQNNYQNLIKTLISFLWLSMLAKANTHDLPRHNEERIHKAATVRGRINVRKSLIPLFTESKLVSIYNEKSLDKTIAVILNQAHRILLKDYYLGTLNISENAEDAIEQLRTSGIKNQYINEHQYQKITYKDIYQPFKPIVDLSWDIIKKKSIAGHQNSVNSNSFSFFIDMAEIWEMYLKSLLKRNLSKYGWQIRNDKVIAYQGKAFRRSMIPDIVLQKDNKIVVLDAKYKRMKFDYFDYDRLDFFQIHTYISYYQQTYDVVLGGLLYPISREFDFLQQQNNLSTSLFSLNSRNTKFVVDGIEFPKTKHRDLINSFIEEENNFVCRIQNLLKT